MFLRIALFLVCLSLSAAPATTTLIVNAPAATGVTIGAEAVLAPVSTAAYWNAFSSYSPGTNDVVTINPPLFNWIFSPGTGFNGATDTNIYSFILQVDTNISSLWTSPLINVSNIFCGYNYLAPLPTNNTIYWRVGYINANGTTNSWQTNQFTISGSATNWDRSALSTNSYRTSHAAHPHMLFTAANLAAVSSFVQTNDTNSWHTLTNDAYVNGLTQSWWTNTAAWATNGSLSPNESTRGFEMAEVSFLVQILGTNTMWTNGTADCFNRMCTFFIGWQGPVRDFSAGSDNVIPGLAFGYDWLYSILPTSYQTNAQYAMDLTAQWQLDALGYYNQINDNNLTAPFTPIYAPYSIAAKCSTSHAYESYLTYEFMLNLSAYGEDTASATVMDAIINYYLARKSPWGNTASFNQGRSYSYLDELNYFTLLPNYQMLTVAFPEMGFGQDPYWYNAADWWMRMVPPGYAQAHETFGDSDLGVGNVLWYYPSLLELAAYSSNTVAETQITSENTVYQKWHTAIPYSQLDNRYFWPTNSGTTNAALGICYPTDGWAFGSSYPPGNVSNFQSGTGFIMMARPAGGLRAHTEANDSDYEFYAYGANVTETSGEYNATTRVSWCHNCVAINGLGQMETYEGPLVPEYSQIIAFTNSPDFIYAAADSTYCYPHTPWFSTNDPQWPGPDGWPTNYGNLLTNGYVLGGVTKVQRHILFVHHRYFVVFDDLASKTNYTWQSVYHVHYNTVSNFLSTGSYDFTLPQMSATPGVQPSWTTPVKVYVREMLNPTLFSATNYSGTNAYENPITGESYFSYTQVTDNGNNTNNLMTNSIWECSSSASTNFHFMRVIYPVASGGTVPTITRADDYTANIIDNGTNDVVTFNPSPPTGYTLRVNSTFITNSLTPLPTPPIY